MREKHDKEGTLTFVSLEVPGSSSNKARINISLRISDGSASKVGVSEGMLDIADIRFSLSA
jgi:hypothetical protein